MLSLFTLFTLCSYFGYLAIHSGINALLAYLLVGLWSCWQIPVIVFFTHYLIDFTKSSIGSSSLWIFIADQMAHLAVIIGLWTWLADATLCFDVVWLSDYRVWIVALCYMLSLKPTSILLGIFIAKWTPSDIDKNSLPNAGAWIGYLERVLILTFMLVGCMEGIGFLLAAKSIFRFGELTKAREVKITEYVMIGTLFSFTVAIHLITDGRNVILSLPLEHWNSYHASLSRSSQRTQIPNTYPHQHPLCIWA